MATAAATPKVEIPKKTLAQPSPSDPNHSSLPEDVHPLTTTNSTSTASPPPPAETKAGAISSENADAGDAVTDVQKKIRRAERFGMPVQLSEEEKRNSRAERFGTGTGSHGSEGLKKSEENKRKARAERFGLAQTTSADEEAKKKARLARFTPASKVDPVEEDKRKARAIRFSQNQSTSLTQANGNEMKAAVTGKAGGVR
ncbi:hypothetical protein ACH5RR_004791 [Cinchona calisaya]|uniref:THO1-MOS11 C-terminal domain-containing protein n=1 Tax=Cinchona calisaya TaxID=153742 RepID=A0ABD3AZ08_9GENT